MLCVLKVFKSLGFDGGVAWEKSTNLRDRRHFSEVGKALGELVS